MKKAAFTLTLLMLFAVPASADTILNYVLTGYHTGTISWQIPQPFAPAEISPDQGWGSSFHVNVLTNYGPADIGFWWAGDVWGICPGCPEGFFYFSDGPLYIDPPPGADPWMPTLLTGTFQVYELDLYDPEGDRMATLAVSAVDIPEPASLVLLTTGLLGLIGRKLRT